jgi:anti-sigma regulatory factor (Ser/Thr protein kinase)
VKLVDVLAVVEEAVESVCSGQALSSIMNGGSVSGRLWQLDPMDDTVRESRTTGGEKVDMYLDAAPQNWLYVLEPGALRRVVMNVFGNALKHTESGSVSLHIEAQTSKNDCPVLMMTVSDTGRGISNDYLRSHVFTPFSQEDPMSPGAGLGLSLVRAILRSLGGSIAIKSQLGVGTVVKITFPLTYPQQQKLPETESPFPGLHSPVVTSIDRVTTKLKGRRVFFYPADNFHPSKPSSSYMIKQYLTKWFGMANGDHAVPTTSDLVVVDERHLDQLPSAYRPSLLLVLSHRGPNLWSKVTSAKEQLLNSIWLTLPCGPHQLARILLGSLETLQLRKTDTSRNTAKYDQSQDQSQDLDSNSTDPRTKRAFLLQHEVQLKSTNPSLSVTSSIPSEEISNPTVIDRELPVRIQKDIQQTHASTPTEAKDGLRVLLVEDNAINLALLKKSISRVRTQVLHCAVNGAKAVELVQKMPQGYDYIFMGE